MPGLQDLPQEVIAAALHYLDKRDLTSFTLVDQQCERAAREQRFSTILFTLQPIERFSRDLKNATEALDRKDSYRHVRQIKIQDVANENITERKRRGPCEHDSKPPREEEPVDWASTVHLLKCLPGLRDLLWDSCRMFPAPLLQALHNQVPFIRLHVERFSLPSLIVARDQPFPELTEHEKNLSTSPNLFDVSLWYCSRLDVTSNANLAALYAMVTGHAPNLERVRVYPDILCPHLKQDKPVRNNPRTLPSPRPVEIFGPFPISQGRITHLYLDSGASRLDTWLAMGKLEHLEVLTYRTFFWEKDVNWIGKVHLPRLKRLTLRETPAFPSPISPVMPEWCSTFLLSLTSRLDALTLDYSLTWDRLEPILKHFGPGIQDLAIPCLLIRDRAELEALASLCPNLQTLSFAMFRMHSKPPEQAIFFGLGELFRLKMVSITLDCAVMTTSEEDMEEWETSERLIGILAGALEEYPHLAYIAPRSQVDIIRAASNAQLPDDLVNNIFRAIAIPPGGESLTLDVLELKTRRLGEVLDLRYDTIRSMELISLQAEINKMEKAAAMMDHSRTVGRSRKCTRIPNATPYDEVACTIELLDEDEEERKVNIVQDNKRGLDIRTLVPLDD